jgi:protoporphyrinogen oxidase
MTRHYPLAVVGAGPAGLAAAHESLQYGIGPVVFEKAGQVGGISRTDVYRGYRFDIGGHRFFTKVEEIQRLWQQLLGEDFLEVSRLSRLYYRGQFFKYPLELVDTFSKLGVTESARILASYLRARIRPHPQEDTFDQWVTNRFGSRLYEMFFRTYTEKIWGIPCSELQADWVAQRIAGLSLRTVLSSILFRASEARSLIRQFHYPVLGPGMMWQRFSEEVEARGGQVLTRHSVIRLFRDAERIIALGVAHRGQERRICADSVISSMPLGELVPAIEPLPPPAVVQAAKGLKYRDFILVALIARCAVRFPDQWIYIHSPDVRVGRIQNFANWSAAMVPDQRTTSLGMEYFCSEGDEIWQMPDDQLVSLAKRELAQLRLVQESDVLDGLVVRQLKAYPVYDGEYRDHLTTIRGFLATLSNLQTVGRNGMHRYNNMDHSMLTGMLAVRNLFGGKHDLWQVNTDESHHEVSTLGSSSAQPVLRGGWCARRSISRPATKE